MPTLAGPYAAAPTGAETITIYQLGQARTLTLAQLKRWVGNAAIGAGASNPPVGQPSPDALDGTEQIQVFQGAGWGNATLAQLKAWTLTGTAGAYVGAATGGRLSGIPLGNLDGTMATTIVQNLGVKAITFASLQSYLLA